MSDWKQQIEAQIATIDRFPKYLPSGLHTSEITALLRPLLDVAVAAERCIPDVGYIDDHDLDAMAAALDKLREVGDE